MSEPGNRTNKTVSVFAAHTDDIEIGMAGAICRLTGGGNQIHVGIASMADDRALRIREAQEAAGILGIKAGITNLFNDDDHSHRHDGKASCRGKSRR